MTPETLADNILKAEPISREEVSVLRWILNVSQPHDRPRMHLETAFDKHVGPDLKTTNRESLESLWRKISYESQPFADMVEALKLIRDTKFSEKTAEDICFYKSLVASNALKKVGIE